MNVYAHPYRAPAIMPASFRDACNTIASVLMFVAMVGAVVAGVRDDERLAAQRRDLPRLSARAEMNARAYVRSAYGVDPWVRCAAGACDVVVGQAAPFRLWCDTTPDGGCSLGGAR